MQFIEYCCCLVTKSCPTLSNPMDCSLPLFYPWITQARILEWVTISLSRGYSRPRDWTHISCIACGFLPLSHQGSPYWILYWKWKTECLYEYRMVLCVSVVYPHDHAADWELQLVVAVRHHRVSYLTPLTPGKKINKIQNLKYSFYWMCIAFSSL